MTSRTRFRSLSRTGAVPLTTCDTVPIETCARSAISFMVAGLVIGANQFRFVRRGYGASRSPSFLPPTGWQLTVRLERSGIPQRPNDPCSAPSSRVYRALSIYMLGGNTRSIPAAGNNFRLAEFRPLYAHPEIHPSIATRCQPGPSLRRGSLLSDARKRHRGPSSSGPCPEREQQKHPTDFPTDRGAHPCFGQHIAIPIRTANASPSRRHKHAHLQVKPK